jgi:hypothetical protein
MKSSISQPSVVPKVVLRLWSSGEFLCLLFLLQISGAFYVRLQQESLIAKLFIEVELERSGGFQFSSI